MRVSNCNKKRTQRRKKRASSTTKNKEIQGPKRWPRINLERMEGRAKRVALSPRTSPCISQRCGCRIEGGGEWCKRELGSFPAKMEKHQLSCVETTTEKRKEKHNKTTVRAERREKKTRSERQRRGGCMKRDDVERAGCLSRQESPSLLDVPTFGLGPTQSWPPVAWTGLDKLHQSRDARGSVGLRGVASLQADDWLAMLLQRRTRRRGARGAGELTR